MKKKRIMSIVLAAAMAVSIAGCGSSSESTSNGENTQAEGENSKAPEGATTVEVWTEDRHDLEYVEKMVDQYNQNNKDGIFINLTVITEDYKNMLALAYNGGTAPDVVGANSLPLNTFADTGILMPLNDYIDSDETFQKVNEPYEHVYEGENTRNGNIYFVYSGMRSGVRVEYNKNILSECGYTEIPSKLEDYIDMAKDITKKGE